MACRGGPASSVGRALLVLAARHSILPAAGSLLTDARSALDIAEDGGECQSLHLLQQRREAQKRRSADQAHPWPHARGASPEHGATSHVGPRSLNSSLAWTWHHPEGKYFTTVAGSAVIDAKGNIYLGTNDGVRKFSPGGGTLWHYRPPGDMNNQVSLDGGYLYGNTGTGWGFALDIEDGRVHWVRQYSDVIGGDVGYPAANAGIFVMGIDSHTAKGTGQGNSRVLAVNASTGDELWDFRPEYGVWNFMPLFPPPGNETVLFMDWTGGVYKLDLHSGRLLWHSPSPGAEESFTDGGMILGPNGAAYTCSNAGAGSGQEGQFGLLRALELESGEVLWKRILPQPCNSWPAVGHLNPGHSGPGKLSVVVDIGSFPTAPGFPTALPKHAGVNAYDAATGMLEWQFMAPPFERASAMGDYEGLGTRLGYDPQHPICLPAPWSAPTIAGDGAVYAGHLDGKVYVVRGPPAATANSSLGTLVDELSYRPTPGVEVDTFHTGSAFLGGGTAWDAGTMAIATCDSLYVFQYDEP